MKHEALCSSKDKSKKDKSVVCCNFAWRLKGLRTITLIISGVPIFRYFYSSNEGSQHMFLLRNKKNNL